jgi:glutamate 5-kinase
VATNEIKNSRFGDNDELSYLVAKLIKVDLLVTLTDIDGLYTGNPKKDSAARLISTVDANDDSVFNLIEDIPNDRSRGGMSSKLMYATKAAKMGIPVILANGRTQNSITEIFSGKEMGTLITAERFSR